MSKRCCGMIYSDEEQTCKICGKELNDDGENTSPDIKANDETQGETDMAGAGESARKEDFTEKNAEESDTEADFGKTPVGETAEDDGEITRKKKDRAPLSLKLVGIMSLTVAVLGLAVVTICLYFMVLFPSYDKSDSADKPLYFPEAATASDADITSVRGVLSPTDAISEDYFKESAVNQDASVSDASASDAEASGAGASTE